jgi:hypothetical protein
VLPDLMDHRQHRDPGKNAQTPYLRRGARAAALRRQHRESETERDRPPEAGLVPRPPITKKPRLCSSPQERAGNNEITQALLKSMAYRDPVLLNRLAALADGRAMLAKRYPKP